MRIIRHSRLIALSIVVMTGFMGSVQAEVQVIPMPETHPGFCYRIPANEMKSLEEQYESCRVFSFLDSEEDLKKCESVRASYDVIGKEKQRFVQESETLKEMYNALLAQNRNYLKGVAEKADSPESAVKRTLGQLADSFLLANGHDSCWVDVDMEVHYSKETPLGITITDIQRRTTPRAGCQASLVAKACVLEEKASSEVEQKKMIEPLASEESSGAPKLAIEPSNEPTALAAVATPDSKETPEQPDVIVSYPDQPDAPVLEETSSSTIVVKRKHSQAAQITPPEPAPVKVAKAEPKPLIEPESPEEESAKPTLISQAPNPTPLTKALPPARNTDSSGLSTKSTKNVQPIGISRSQCGWAMLENTGKEVTSEAYATMYDHFYKKVGEIFVQSINPGDQTAISFPENVTRIELTKNKALPINCWPGQNVAENPNKLPVKLAPNKSLQLDLPQWDFSKFGNKVGKWFKRFKRTKPTEEAQNTDSGLTQD